MSTPEVRGNAQFEEIHVIKNSEGVLLSITRRAKDGMLSLALYKEFERNGDTERTSYIQPRQIEQALDLFHLGKAWIEKYQQEHPTEPVMRRNHARHRHGSRS